MAKKIIVLFFVLFSSASFADNLSFQFDKAKLSDVVNYVVRSILHSDFVISRDVPLDQEVTFKLSNVPKQDVLPQFKKILNSFDVDIVDTGSFLSVVKYVRPVGSVDPVSLSSAPVVSSLSDFSVDKPELPSDDVRVYSPRYRSVEYLSPLVKLAGGRLVDSGVSGFSPGFSSLPQRSAPVVNSLSALNQAAQNQAVNQPYGYPVAGSVVQGKTLDVVVFSASDKVYQKILDLFEKVDVIPQSVQIKAVVLEVTTGDDSQRSLSLLASLLSSKLGVVFDAGAVASNQLSLKLPNLSALLSAVDGDSRFKYLSEPYMRVVDGESAKLTVGQEVPTRGAVVQNSTGQNIQSIEYRTAGLLLDISPRVFVDSVQLKINQEISSFTTTNTSGIDSPTLLKRQVSSVVRLREGELFILGGLDEERDTSSSSGLFFLPDFLASKVRSRSKSQILIIMELKRLDVPQLNL